MTEDGFFTIEVPKCLMSHYSVNLNACNGQKEEMEEMEEMEAHAKKQNLVITIMSVIRKPNKKDLIILVSHQIISVKDT